MANAKSASAHLGFLRHADFRWAKFALALCVAGIVAYVWHDAPDGPNGGTWLGYTLGGISALLIVWLLWLGVRKRRYRSGSATVKGWTSAHVYLGLSLLVIASLHCGFQFGLNIHTLSYVLMVLVVCSGLWGLIAYDRLPSQITLLRDGATREAWIEEVFDLNDQAVRLADQLGPDVHRKIVASADKLRLGGGLLDQLRGPRPVRELQSMSELLKERLELLRAGNPRSEGIDSSKQNTVMFMAGQLEKQGKGEKEIVYVQQLLDLLTRRNDLVARINRDIGLHARLQLWLLVHVPLSLALLAALIAHIVSVFFYW